VSNHTVGHNRNPGDIGDGWTGVTHEQKDHAAGRDTWDVVAHTERVARLQGSGYWTRQGEVWFP
jgi:hypothetical protein